MFKFATCVLCVCVCVRCMGDSVKGRVEYFYFYFFPYRMKTEKVRLPEYDDVCTLQTPKTFMVMAKYSCVFFFFSNIWNVE